jgi:hypothetical protein
MRRFVNTSRYWPLFVLPDDGSQMFSGEVVATAKHRERDFSGRGLAL